MSARHEAQCRRIWSVAFGDREDSAVFDWLVSGYLRELERIDRRAADTLRLLIAVRRPPRQVPRLGEQLKIGYEQEARI